MCLTFLYVNPTADKGRYQLVLINNRDEMYDRPTANATFWNEDLLCSRDMQMGSANGTWLAISRKGRIANLLNILEPHNGENNGKGRGHLVLDFVNSTKDTTAYCSQIDPRSYSGFSLICLSLVKKSRIDKRWKISYVTNRDEKMETEDLSHGYHGFGNSVKDAPFNKVQYGLKKFQNSLESATNQSELIESLLEILKDRTTMFPDEQIISQATHLDWETQKSISSCFVAWPHVGYGTRTHTIILIDSDENVTFLEENLVFDSQNLPTWESKQFHFQLRL